MHYFVKSFQVLFSVAVLQIPCCFIILLKNISSKFVNIQWWPRLMSNFRNVTSSPVIHMYDYARKEHKTLEQSWSQET